MFFTKATSGRTDFIWYALGIVAVIACYFMGSIPLLLVQLYKVSADVTIGTAEVDKFHETMDFSYLNIGNNLGFVLMITVFIIATLGFMLVIKYVHHRPFKNLITPNPKINYDKIFFAFGFWLVLAIIFEAILYFMHPETYTMTFKPINWIILLLICIFLLPIQSTFEELFVRGYLMPAVALISQNKWIPLVLTSVVFGLIHSDNPEIDKYGFWTMQVYYIGAGLFLGLITILDDSLELAIGVHAATNIFGAAIVTMEGSVLQTDSILKASPSGPYLMILIFFLSAVIFMFVCNKKYGWNGLSRLFAPIGSEEADQYESKSSTTV
ncbi:MAG: type II CAAX endopeptidase family protein [Bacteroidota bacterium]